MAEDLPLPLQQMLALWNGERVDPADVYASGCRLNGGPATFEPEEVAHAVATLRSAFSDLRFAVTASFRAGNRFVLSMTAAGTTSGAPYSTPIGVAAVSGAAVELPGIEVFEVRGERVVDVWLAWDFAPLYAALGARFPGEVQAS